MFRFSISDLGHFLGKSPVTIRAWERKKLVSLPRVGINRSLAVEDVRQVALWANKVGRITPERFTMIIDALGALSLLEQENV